MNYLPRVRIDVVIEHKLIVKESNSVDIVGEMDFIIAENMFNIIRHI